MTDTSGPKDEKPDWRELVHKPEEWQHINYSDPRLDDFAEVVEQRYQLPKGLLIAVKNAGERTPAKSSGRPTVSSAGAKGVMQFIDSTRQTYQHDPNNPFASIDAAGRYFQDLLKRYKGDVKAAVTEYNGGVWQAQHVQKGGNPTALETQKYLARIKEYMEERQRKKKEEASGT